MQELEATELLPEILAVAVAVFSQDLSGPRFSKFQCGSEQTGVFSLGDKPLCTFEVLTTTATFIVTTTQILQAVSV